MLARERAANFDTIANDFSRCLHGALKLTLVAGIIENNGVEVAVSRMKNIADVEAVAGADFADAAKGLRKLGSRNDAIEDVIAGSEPAECAESVLAAFPKEFALGVVTCKAHFAGAVLVANLGDGDSLSGNGF